MTGTIPEDTYQVVLKFTRREYQTFIIKADDPDQIRAKIATDFLNAAEEGEEISDLEILEITPIELVQKPVDGPKAPAGTPNGVDTDASPEAPEANTEAINSKEKLH